MDFVTGFKRTIARLGFAKVAGMATIAAATLGLLLWISTNPLEPKSLLYSGLDPAESAKIGQKLDELKVPFDVRGDGTTIVVPASQVARARMELAAAGLPHQGGAGYELLDQQSPMNMTSFMQRIQHLRALEGELARTIVTLDGVRSARVHIVLPERETFARDTPKATASVAVTMAGPARLTTQQAAAIRLLVSGAVPGLSGDSVSVLDPNGVVMAADDGEGAASGRLSELKAAREQELKHAVTDLLEPLVGHDKLRVEASVELDDSREVSHEEKFDPLSQIERSKQIESDQDATNETKSSEPVSVAQNMPNQGSGQSGEPGKASTNNSRNGQTINYEINSVRSDRVREAGELKRMTIAVVVDGITDDKGHYQERAQDELTRLSELIQSAVGFDANRGDRVTVETMRFMPETPIGTAADADPRQFGQTPVTWIAIGGTVALVLVGGMLMMRKRGKARSGEWDEDGAAPMPYLSSDSRLAAAMAGASQLAAGVDGQLRPALAAAGMAENPQQTLLTALFDTVDQRPDEAVAALRSWLSGTA